MYEAQIKNLKKARLARKIKKIKLFCPVCNTIFYRYPRNIKKHNACSVKCSNQYKKHYISKKMKGRKMPEKTKVKLRQYKGEKASSWKGGKPKCKICNKEIQYNSNYCQKHKAINKKLSEQHKYSISNKLTGKMPKNIMRPGKFMNIKRGYFDINGKRIFFRSKWEANYALYLDFLTKQKEIKKWTYEKDMFIFHKIVSGTRTYRPDFKIYNNDGSFEYHEVKGYMDAKSKTKIKRMKKYYPNIKLIIIDKPVYNDIKNKIGGLLKFY